MPPFALLAAGSLLPLIATLPIATAQQSAPAAAQVDIVDITADRNERMTVPVRIGPAGPFRFIVDTGAERTILARQVATHLGLAPTDTATVVSVAGIEPVDVVEVDEIALGRRSFHGLSAPLLDARWIGADGIIGLDGLQGQRVLLDFQHNRMAIGSTQSLGGNNGYEIVVEARRKQGQLIMTNALVDGVKTDIIIDTGSDTSIGNLALQRALANKSPGATADLVSVTGQSVKAVLGANHTVTLNGVSMTNTLLAFTDAPPFQRLKMDSRPAMLLGINQLRPFRRVAIDFAQRKILFDIPDDLLADR